MINVLCLFVLRCLLVCVCSCFACYVLVLGCCAWLLLDLFFCLCFLRGMPVLVSYVWVLLVRVCYVLVPLHVFGLFLLFAICC